MTTNFDEMIKYTRNEWASNHEYFSKVLAIVNERKIRYFADLGACLGEVSKILIASVPSIEKVTVIEPIPTNYALLLENLKSQRCSISYVNKAVYYGENQVTMGTDLSNMGGFGIQGQGFGRNHEQVTENIETTTLETIFANQLPDFIKIDVEGAEKNIIEKSQAIKLIPLIELELHHTLIDEQVHQDFLTTHLPNYRILAKSSTWCCCNVLLERM